MLETLLGFAPSAAIAVLVIILLFVLQRALNRGVGTDGHQARNQLILLGVTSAGLLVIILTMPIGDSTRGQILGLLGIVLSAGIALSSTTFLGNAMAGIMLRAVKNFRMGDFIRTGDHFGRVSERGIFHTEIQTEDRELTTLPNLYLVTNPVTTIRSSGTVIAATVSLGYDVNRARITELLLRAAERAELEDPFVQVLELGDYSVTYRIAGLLSDVKHFITARSRLRGCVMDALHDGKVEIVSPTFMNTRALAEGRVFIPKKHRGASIEELESAPESVVFDKAEEAESLQDLKDQRKHLTLQIAVLEKQIAAAEETDDVSASEAERDRLQRRAERLDKLIAGREASHKDMT